MLRSGDMLSFINVGKEFNIEIRKGFDVRGAIGVYSNIDVKFDVEI
jgi:hypothetical protein